jgi:hypothetical protein
MLVLRVAEEPPGNRMKSGLRTARLAPDEQLNQMDKLVFHDSLERIQAIAADEAAGRNRAMVVSIKAPKQDSRRDADFVSPPN